MSSQPGRKGRERGEEEARAWLTANREAFTAWPTIEVLPDRFGFHVTGKIIHPKHRFLPGFIGGVLGLAALVGGYVVGWFIEIMMFGKGPPGLLVAAGFFGVPVLTVRMIKNASREWGGSSVDVIITPERIGIGRTFEYEWIERRFGAAFEVVRPHSKAYEDEVDGRYISPKERQIYGKSDEVILMSGARRVTVSEIYNDKRRTERLHMTLFILNQVVN